MNPLSFNEKTADKIETIGKEAQALINKEFEKVNNEIKSGSVLAQEGLKNGLKIVKKYNTQGELTLALEHVLYMVYETGIMLDKSSYELMLELCKELQISSGYLKR